MGSLAFSWFGHCTVFAYFGATGAALAEFVFHHRIIARTATTKFFSREDVPNVDQGEAEAEDHKDYSDDGE